MGVLVALASAFFGLLLPKLSQEKKEICYSIDSSEKYVDCTVNRDMKVTINGIATSNLFACKVRLWSPGDLPIKNLAVLFKFYTNKKDFKIFNVAHNTKPQFEFGEIREEKSDHYSKRFVYELFNQGNEDIITFWTNDCPKLEVYAKSEELRVRRIMPQEAEDLGALATKVLIGILISVVCVIITWVLIIRLLNRNIDELSKVVVKVGTEQKETRFENIDREIEEEVRGFQKRFSRKFEKGDLGSDTSG
jgi:hypothetical protein